MGPESADDDDGTVIRPTLVPSPAAGDPKQLSLGRLEGFILSLVDGRSSIDELASIAGLPAEEVCDVVVRLRELGAVLLPGDLGVRKGKPRRGQRSDKPAAKRSAGSLPPDCIPRLRGASHSSLDIEVRDAFVLAQIDGGTSLSELSAIAGIDIEVLSETLERLENAGAIELHGAPAAEAEGRGPRAALSVEVFTSRAQRKHQHDQSRRASPAPRKAPEPVRHPTPTPSRRKTPPPPRRATPPPSRRPMSRRSAPAPAADDETCELDPATQGEIDALYAILPTATHYDLLRVSREADGKAIKSAYFGFVATLHPDRHFRKKLGPYRKKIEEVFVRLTRAYETLDRASTRAEYDRGLGPPRLGPAAPAAPVAPVVIQERPAEPGPVSRARIRVRSTVAGMRASSQPVRVPPSSSPERLAAAARAEPPRRPNPGVDPFEVLKRFFDEKVDQEGRQRAKVFAEAGEYELAKGNVIAAASQFQLALDCCDTPEVRAAFEAVEGKAQARKAEVALGQAEAAERHERWSEAASSYARAHAARPDGRIAERLANAIRRDAGDLREAAKLAEKAVHQEPDNAGYRVTLGEIYADAGLELRARAEAKRAIELAPGDPRAKSLAEKLAKGAAR